MEKVNEKVMEKMVQRIEGETIDKRKEAGAMLPLSGPKGSIREWCMEVKRKKLLPVEHQIAERIQLVVNDPDNYISLPEDIHRQILKDFKKSAASYYENSAAWLLKIQHFCAWLERQNTGDKCATVEKQLNSMLEKLTRRCTKKGINELFQLLYTNKLLLSLYYIYLGLSDRDWAFLDKLIWQSYVPYPEALKLYGETLFEKAASQDDVFILKAAYGKWEDILTMNHFEGDPSGPLDDNHDDDDYYYYHEGTSVYDNIGHNTAKTDANRPSEDQDNQHLYNNNSCSISSSTVSGIINNNVQCTVLWRSPEKLVFALPTFLRLAFTKIARKSAACYLRPITLSDRCEITMNEATVYTELPKVIAYIEQGKLKYTKSGFIGIGSLKIATNKLWLSCLGLDRRSFVKTMLMASHLDDERYTSTAPVLDILSQLLQLKRPDLQIMNATLFPFNSLRELSLDSFNYNAMSDTFKLLEILHEAEWIELDQLLHYLAFHDLLSALNPLKDEEFLWVVKIAEFNPAFASYNEGDINARVNYLTKAFITSILLTAASFGLLDLACDPNDYKLRCFTIGETYPWLSFTACRLTPLGAHFFKGKKDYAPPAAVAGNTAI